MFTAPMLHTGILNSRHFIPACLPALVDYLLPSLPSETTPPASLPSETTPTCSMLRDGSQRGYCFISPSNSAESSINFHRMNLNLCLLSFDTGVENSVKGRVPLPQMQGIDKIEIDAEKSTVTVTGEVDPVAVVKQVRKIKKMVEIVTVGPPPKPEPKPDPKPDPKPCDLPTCCRSCEHISVTVERYGGCTIM
ncbi:hypothetical protein EJ110_NYTH10086 [Nymphaea thermarum]|nr:hypothetical protein EJ110_NYTH10086 [Nymphaea thermarum]